MFWDYAHNIEGHRASKSLEIFMLISKKKSSNAVKSCSTVFIIMVILSSESIPYTERFMPIRFFSLINEHDIHQIVKRSCEL